MRLCIASISLSALMFASAPAIADQGPLQRASQATDRAATQAAQLATDSWITTKIREKLIEQSTAESRHISVHTQDRIVTLSGTVWSRNEQHRALALARHTKGVDAVVDGMTVQAPLSPGG